MHIEPLSLSIYIYMYVYNFKFIGDADARLSQKYDINREILF